VQPVIEILLGRALAICSHPIAAWRSSSPRRRIVLVSGYFGAGYVGVLVALALLAN
jgi:hypothetical protein